MFLADCVVCHFMIFMEESHKDIGGVYRLLDRKTDIKTDRQKNGQTDGRTDGLTD